jgi:tetratricopeptide (TPR) repeat protein
MPWEGLLELATFYLSAGLEADGKALLEGLPTHPLALYWRAWLERSDPRVSQQVLAQADGQPVGHAFAFREEMLPVLRWAAATSGHWRARYHLALLLHHKNRREEAIALVRALADRPEEPAFYALRALWVGDGAEAERDLRRALSMDPAEWRYPKLLTQLLIRRGEAASALSVAEGYVRARGEGKAPIMDMLLAKTLLLNRRYADCDALLSRMQIIPFEGSTDGRALYWEAKMMMAVDAFGRKDYKLALRQVQAAAEWPEHLGVGKPYDADIDTRLERYLEHLCQLRLGRKPQAETSLAAILSYQPSISNTITQFQPANHLVTKWAMEARGEGGRWDAWMRGQEQAFPRHAEAFAQVRRLASATAAPGTAADDPWMRVIRALQPLAR